MSVGVLLGSSHLAKGQKLSHFAQYYLIPHAINPSFTGIEDYLDLKAGVRLSTLTRDVTTNGASQPQNYFVAANFSIRPPEKINPAFKSLRISNPSAAANFANAVYQERFIQRHGIGVTFSRRDIGGYENTTGLLSYALHVPIWEEISASLGISSGVVQSVLKAGEYNIFDENDPIYVDLVNNQGNIFSADLNAGINVYHPNFYVGYAMNQLLRGTFFNATEGDSSATAINYFTHTGQLGVQFLITPDFELQLSGVVNQSPDLGFTYTGGVKLQYHDALTFGVGYRNEGAITGYIGLLSDYRFTVAYSFDYIIPTVTASQYLFGSHEVVLGLTLNNRLYKPPYFW